MLLWSRDWGGSSRQSSCGTTIVGYALQVDLQMIAGVIGSSPPKTIKANVTDGS